MPRCDTQRQLVALIEIVTQWYYLSNTAIHNGENKIDLGKEMQCVSYENTSLPWQAILENILKNCFAYVRI